jgi:hypothetical protein
MESLHPASGGSSGDHSHASRGNGRAGASSSAALAAAPAAASSSKAAKSADVKALLKLAGALYNIVPGKPGVMAGVAKRVWTFRGGWHGRPCCAPTGSIGFHRLVVGVAPCLAVVQCDTLPCLAMPFLSCRATMPSALADFNARNCALLSPGGGCIAVAQSQLASGG